jgi:protein CpxP
MQHLTDGYKMNRNKLKMLALITLAGAVLVAPIARAEDENADGRKPHPRKGAKGPQGEARGPRLAEALNLTDEQKEKMKAIREEARPKLEALRQDTTLTPEDRRAKVREIRESIDAQIKALLTTEQIEKWEKMKEGPRKRRAPQE